MTNVFSPLDGNRVESVYSYFDQQCRLSNCDPDEMWIALHMKYIDRVKKGARLESVKNDLAARVAQSVSAMDIDARIETAIKLFVNPVESADSNKTKIITAASYEASIRASTKKPMSKCVIKDVQHYTVSAYIEMLAVENPSNEYFKLSNRELRLFINHIYNHCVKWNINFHRQRSDSNQWPHLYSVDTLSEAYSSFLEELDKTRKLSATAAVKAPASAMDEVDEFFVTT